MPIGAMKVSFDFSAASMRTVKTSWEVRNYVPKSAQPDAGATFS